MQADLRAVDFLIMAFCSAWRYIESGLEADGAGIVDETLGFQFKFLNSKKE